MQPNVTRNIDMKNKTSNLAIYRRDIVQNKYIYIMALPMLIYYIVFHYLPMYGVIIAFKTFDPSQGIIGSKWVGLKNFKDFFNSYYSTTIIKNTLLMSIYDLIWGFPAPIILALLLNELTNQRFKRTVQTVSYMPHFISLVVICGMIKDFTATDGVINDLIQLVGGQPSNLLGRPELFRTIFVSSGIWQGIGWGSIIYLAALSRINPELYEAARIDGAGRWKQTIHVTLPSIAPTIVILLILRVGSIMSVGFEKIILLYNPMTYETADVISSFVYRKGILDFNYSFSAAVGLFNSIINFALLVFTNYMSKQISETSLW